MKVYKVKVNGRVFEVEVEAVEEKQGHVAQEPVKDVQPQANTAPSGSTIIAPIAGKVTEIRVKPGQNIKEGETVMIIEAMKLENEIQSPFSGKVRDILVQSGSDVRNKDVLITLE